MLFLFRIVILGFAAFAGVDHAVLPAWGQNAPGELDRLVARAVNRLIELQEDDGAWPYEGVYRVRGEIPVGYRVGGTAIVCQSLLYAAADDLAKRDAAIERGIERLLVELKDSRMQPSQQDRYDVRVWGHIYALDLFCRLESTSRFAAVRPKTAPWIAKLVDALVQEEIDGGGWNYANRRSHACFVTAPAVQALLLARHTGADVPDKLFERSARVLSKSRVEDGAFQYSGIDATKRPAKLPGSIARSAVCESTLLLLGQGNVDHLKLSIDAFHEHWEELEKRRQKTGTHQPPYGVAPYYFYYGHRYLAQAIAMLPPEQRAAEQRRFVQVLLQTKERDNTWNDRVFERSKAFGTAMAVLALNQHQLPPPDRLGAKLKQND